MRAAGGKAPALDREPGLPSHLVHYWTAFFTLSNDRLIVAGFGAAMQGHIPWTVKDRYAERHGYTNDPDDYADFMFLISELDRVYVEKINAETAKNLNKTPVKSTAKPRKRK